MTPPVVGLAGRMQAGKSTVAAYLVGAHGYRKVAFADALRDAVATLNPVVAWDEDGGPIRYCDVVAAFGYEGAKARYREVRRVLQVLGTDVVRALDDNAWCRAWLRRVCAGTGQVVADDVRFVNEVDHVHALGGEVWWVGRPGCDDGEHPSEHALAAKDCDHVLTNDGTIADLHRLIEAHLA